MSMRLVVATRSRHKIREIREILADIEGLELLSLDEAGIGYSPDEEGLEPFETFEENARSKASYFRRKTDLPLVAEDSGLEVDALDGGPGVRTKRFAPGDDLDGDERDGANNAYLLELMVGRPQEERAGRYVCVAALALTPHGVECFRGEAPGRVLEAPRGSSGFGYDPVMLHEASGRSFAELSSHEKNALSHRGKAFRAVARALRADTGGKQ
jgi:XTP/dITP diphosphohydrolase